jgi:hypothetical protein
MSAGFCVLAVWCSQIFANRSEPRLASGHEADGVPAAPLTVDATLDAYSSGDGVFSACLHRASLSVAAVSDGGACAPMMRAECVGVRGWEPRRDPGCGGKA